MTTSSTPNNNIRLTTLDVFGAGVSIEMFQQLKIIRELKKHPRKSMLPTDKRAYATKRDERKLTLKRRSAYVLASAVEKFVQNWPIPSVCIWPYLNKDTASQEAILDGYFAEHISSLREESRISTHTLNPLTPVFLNEPEDVVERAFRFFEAYPDVPALLLFATDGDLTRELVGDMSQEKHWEDGPRKFGSMVETVAALLVGRRERVDTFLRPFTGSRATHIHAAGAAKTGFQPSRYLPEAWNAEQIDQFDALRTIATLHRPVRVSYRVDKDDRPTLDPGQQTSLMPPQDRQIAFKEGFDNALKSVPGGKPARILYDTGGPATGSHVVPLSLAVNSALPKSDFFDPEEAIDIGMRIGNSGAASPLALWALAALTCADKKDSSMTVNLRQAEEATITVVTHATQQPIPKATTPIPVARPLQSAPPVHHPEIVRYAAIGTCLRTEDECPQSGYWQCVPADVLAGDRHFIRAGQSFPPIRAKRELSIMEKMMNESPIEVKVATWTLLSYD